MNAMTTQPVQMWNGIQFSYVTEAEAADMEKAGTHERTRGRDANTLHGPDHFKRNAALVADLANDKAPKSKTTRKPPRRAKGKYKTTDMKAEST